MDGKELTFPETIEHAFLKINQHKHANATFYKKFNKSRAVVSQWKTGAAVATPQDELHFLETAMNVLRTFEAKNAKREEAKSVLLSELSTLITV